MNIIVLGSVGSDAGYWVYGPNGWHHVGGWGIESMREVSQALKIIAETRQLKSPELANAATKALADFVNKELSAHVKEGGVVLVH